jgi:hypothetical protein
MKFLLSTFRQSIVYSTSSFSDWLVDEMHKANASAQMYNWDQRVSGKEVRNSESRATGTVSRSFDNYTVS